MAPKKTMGMNTGSQRAHRDLRGAPAAGTAAGLRSCASACARTASRLPAAPCAATAGARAPATAAASRAARSARCPDARRAAPLPRCRRGIAARSRGSEFDGSGGGRSLAEAGPDAAGEGGGCQSSRRARSSVPIQMRSTRSGGSDPSFMPAAISPDRSASQCRTRDHGCGLAIAWSSGCPSTASYASQHSASVRRPLSQRDRAGRPRSRRSAGSAGVPIGSNSIHTPRRSRSS